MVSVNTNMSSYILANYRASARERLRGLSFATPPRPPYRCAIGLLRRWTLRRWTAALLGLTRPAGLSRHHQA